MEEYCARIESEGVMFKVGDIVIYGTHGICRVESVGPLPMAYADKHKQYYTLHPYYQREMVIYAPTDNETIVLRQPITKEEAAALIQAIPVLEEVWIPHEKERELQYRQALHSCDCEGLVRIIKTLHKRRQIRQQSGKRGTAVDDRYFRMAEDQLYGELAYVLEMDRAAMPEYISARIEPAGADAAK